jgi:hypothetical protein
MQRSEKEKLDRKKAGNLSTDTIDVGREKDYRRYIQGNQKFQNESIVLLSISQTTLCGAIGSSLKNSGSRSS